MKALFLNKEDALEYLGLTKIAFNESEKIGLIKPRLIPGNKKEKYSSVELIDFHNRIIDYNESDSTDMKNKDFEILELFTNCTEIYEKRYKKLNKAI